MAYDSGRPLGSDLVSDIDTILQDNQAAIEGMMSKYINGCETRTVGASSITISPGQVMCKNSGDDVRRPRYNPTEITITGADLDTGSLTNDNWYYIYAVTDAVATTFTGKFSLSSTFPSGVTYARKIGAVYYTGGSFLYYRQYKDEIFYLTPRNLVSGTTTANAWTSIQTNLLKALPINIAHIAHLKIEANSGNSGDLYLAMRDSEQTGVTSTGSYFENGNILAVSGSCGAGWHSGDVVNNLYLYTVSGVVQYYSKGTSGWIRCVGYKLTDL